MPLWYKTGPISEHRAVITSAGLFDTSHMAELLIEGPDAFQLLQTALTKDLRSCIGKAGSLVPGRATYGFILKEDGTVLDDAIVMMEARDTFLLVINAGMGEPVQTHLDSLGKDLDVAISNLTGKLCKLDLQGPASAEILKKILKPSSKLKAPFPYFSFVGHYDHLQEGVQTLSGHSILVSRTGYTGEFGFELFVRPDGFVTVWEELLAAGEDAGLIPCGLGARDSLRAGAQLPLSHQDIGDWPARNHPWDFALPWKSKTAFTKEFIGAEALLKATDAEYTLTFLGENGRKVEAGADVLLDGTSIGTVLTCATDMAMGLVEGNVVSMASPNAPESFAPKGLSCGFVKVNQDLPPGTALTLQDKRRSLPVTLVTQLRPHRTARMPWPLT
jgi:aminomethyltransferase